MNDSLASTVIYDPMTGRWADSRPMTRKRAAFSIVEMSGRRVLAAGGLAGNNLDFKTAELFDPQTETWQPAASMNVPRRNHRAALLSDGEVLVIGGSNLFGQR